MTFVSLIKIASTATPATDQPAVIDDNLIKQCQALVNPPLSQSGTTQDAAFWSLCQQFSTMLLNLTVSALPLLTNIRDQRKRVAWLGTLVLLAGVLACTIAMLPVYVTKSQFWGGFCGVCG